MKVASLIKNALFSRSAWLQSLLDPKRDIDAECGHPVEIGLSDYSKAFRRGDVASRVVSVYPDESWTDDPQVYEQEDIEETKFEKEWIRLTQRIPIYPQLHRADVLSGIGRFSIILLGFDDGLGLEEAVAGVDEKGVKTGGKNHQLIYMRSLDETVVKITEAQQDPSNPRYGLPVFYEVNFVEPNGEMNMVSETSKKVKVHWSRVLHIVDNRMNSEVYGLPRMEKVWNRLLDLKKIAGGSSEMFWKGGFPGLSMETQPGLDEEIEIDKEATKEQMEKYMNGLQRYLATTGMNVKSLSVQIADPAPHVATQLKLIATSLGIPWRVFVGSEAAQLASEQDTRAWNRRINRRREEYLSPYMLRPFIERMILVGTLPPVTDGFIIDWGDLNGLSDKEQADVGKTQTEAMKAYAESGLDTLITPVHYFTMILGMTDKEAKAITDAGGEVIQLVDGPAASKSIPTKPA